MKVIRYEHTSPTEITPEERRIVVLVHSAIAGGSLAAVLELASRETLTMFQLIALGCFAVAIPTAIAMVILSRVLFILEGPADLAAGSEGQSWPALSYALAASDQVACYLGFFSAHLAFSMDRWNNLPVCNGLCPVYNMDD